MSKFDDDQMDDLPQQDLWQSIAGGPCTVLPSLLLCDFGNLQKEVCRLEAAGVRALHLDVMDGHFVPNLSYGLPLVRAFRQISDLPLDVHLMIEQPQRYVGEYRDAGADSMTVHVEAADDPGAALREIRKSGAAAGLAFNPPTPVDRIRPYLHLCDVVLVMSVMPGFGGQQFDPIALEKLRGLCNGHPHTYRLQVDGGIHEQTIGQAAQAGAEIFIVGSAIFRHSDYAAQCRKLQQLALRQL